jgi:hypothetical protein
LPLPLAAVQAEAEKPVAEAAPVLNDSGNRYGEQRRPWDLMLGYRTWFSWGHSEDLALGTSLFKFRETYSTVHEFNIDAAWQRLVARVDLGFGDFDNGYFQIEETITGETEPSVDLAGDDLFYVTADLGYRLLQRGDLRCRGCAVDLLAGYQHWQETYVPANPPTPSADEYTWDAVRLGVRGLARRDRLLFQGRFMVSPYAHFTTEAFGLTFVEEAGAFRAEADRSWGLMSDFSVNYQVWRNLALELGYQVFYLDSGPGTYGSTDDFQGSRHVRHGILLGVNWRF